MKFYVRIALFAVCTLALFLALGIPFASAQRITSISRASLSPGSNTQGQSYSYDAEMDGSGRYIIFTSTADNFAAEGNVDGVTHEHVYLRDTTTGVTTQLDVTSDGRTGSPGISFNPGVRTFGSSFDPHISRDGTYAVFISSASDISPDGEGETFGAWAYLKNLQTGDIQRIPFATREDPNKIEYPAYLAINADGSVVVVVSIISDLEDETCDICAWGITIFDRNQNTTTLLDTGVVGNKFNPGISDDGRLIVFENQIGDFSGPTYSYLYDRQTSELTPLNDGALAQSPAISGDGNIIAYTDTSGVPSRIVARDQLADIDIPISDGLSGAEPNGISDFASLSQDGRYIAFLSTADNLVSDDTNGTDDIFVFDRLTSRTTLVSVQGSCQGIVSQEEFNTGPPTISSDGQSITFSVLERLIAADVTDNEGAVIEVADTNVFDDVYVATVNYSARPTRFRSNVVPNTPRVSVDCRGDEANIYVEKILRPRSARVSQRSNRPAPVTVSRIRQTVVIRGTSSGSSRQNDIRRRLAARSSVSTRNLPAGTYTARVKATGVLREGGTVQSRPSRPARFVIED